MSGERFESSALRSTINVTYEPPTAVTATGVPSSEALIMILRRATSSAPHDCDTLSMMLAGGTFMGSRQRYSNTGSRLLLAIVVTCAMLSAATNVRQPARAAASGAEATSVGFLTTVPSGPGALNGLIGVWPSPNGTHLALFWGSDATQNLTYAAWVAPSSPRPYPAVLLPGFYSTVTFGSDGTAYLMGSTMLSSSDPKPALLLRLVPGAESAEVLYSWPADYFAPDRPLSSFAIEYIGDYLFARVGSTSYSGTSALQKFDLNGTPLGEPLTGSDLSARFESATGTLSSKVFGTFSYYDLDTLAETTSTTPVGSGPAAIGHDGSWSTLVGGCGVNAHLIRIGRDAQQILDVSLAGIVPPNPARCDIPGIAVLSDLTTAVGLLDTTGVLHIWLVGPQGQISHLTDIGQTSASVPARFASDNSGRLVVVSESSVPCDTTTCEQVRVAVYSKQGLVGSTTIGGTTGESDIVHGFVSANDNSVALSIIRCTDSTHCAGPSNVTGPDYDIITVTAPTSRESWHDPASANGPPTLKYVALGDSYSAGEGIEPFLEGPEQACHRSSGAYSTRVQPVGFDQPLYALRSDVSAAVEWGFQACSGAYAENVLLTAFHGDPYAQLATVRPDDPNPNDLVVDASTDLITITIGGNDAGFADALSFCWKRADCQKIPSGSGTYADQLNAQVNGVGPRVRAVYEQLRRQAPDALIIVLGYPQLFPETKEEMNCTKLRQHTVKYVTILPGTKKPVVKTFSIGFSIDEQRNFRQLTTSLNAVLSSEVQRIGSSRMIFVPVVDYFRTHEVCGSADDDWVNGPTASISLDLINDQSFHPNASGQRSYADCVNAVFLGTGVPCQRLGF